MKKKILKIGVFVLILTGIVLYALNYWNNYSRERKVLADEIKRKAMYDKILDSASTSPTSLSVDYSKQITTGSPLIFGGVHYPFLEHQEAWDKVAESGVTLLRTDFFPEYSIPNTSIENYKNNINDIQNPLNWKVNFIQRRNSEYANAKKRGMKTMGIISYAPPWLTYSGNQHGVPKDWDIFNDIIGKLYKIHKNNLDYIQIWNEPNYRHFLDTTNSGLTPEEAYRQIVINTINTINKTDKQMNDNRKLPIGLQVSYIPTDAKLFEYVIQDKFIQNNIDFISYHNYHIPEPSWDAFKDVLNKYNLDYPIFLTEWNVDPDLKQQNPLKLSTPAITYTANKFIDYLKMGLAGANYYSLFPIDEKLSTPGHGFMGFYKWQNNQAILLPQARTWRILSKQMALGKGESKIYAVDLTEKSEKQNTNLVDVALEEVGMIDKRINTVGFINTLNQRGVALVNDSTDARNTEIKLANTGFDKFVNVKVYYANAGNEAKTPVYEGLIKAEKGNIRFSFYVPAETVMGILFEEEKEWFRVFKK